MTPQEKAIQLVGAFVQETPRSMDNHHAKRCALICVDEIIKAIDCDWMEVQNLDREHKYWEEVKEEIEKL